MSETTTYTKETLAKRIGFSRPTLDKMLAGKRLPEATEPADRPRRWTEPAIAEWETQSEEVSRVANVLEGLTGIIGFDEFFRQLAQKGARVIQDNNYSLARRFEFARMLWRLPWLSGFVVEESREYRLALCGYLNVIELFERFGVHLAAIEAGTGTARDQQEAERLHAEVLSDENHAGKRLVAAAKKIARAREAAEAPA